MKTMVCLKLLSACVTLLIALTNALPTSREISSKLLFSNAADGKEFSIDTLQEGNLILHECHPSDDRLKQHCDVSGSPADETTLQRCNLTINASHNDSLRVEVQRIYRFKDNKLVVHAGNVVGPRKTEGRTAERAVKLLNSFHIFDNCVPVNVVSTVSSKDGDCLELKQFAIYEDGFDIILPESSDENATLHYQSFDCNGKKIDDFTVLPEQLPGPYDPSIKGLVIPNVAKERSRGVALSSGYRFYPNGSIVKFADDEFISSTEGKTPASAIGDVPFYTACVDLPTDFDKPEEIGCWQYDLDHPHLVLKVQFSPRREKLSSIKNLSKGGFLLALYDGSTMTVRLFRPDRPPFIDNIDVRSDGYLYVSSFDETTGKITVSIMSDHETIITRNSYFLQNYVTN